MKRTFTRLFICTFLISAALTAFAQEADSVKAQTEGKNLIKVNLTAIPLKNYSLTYERAIGRKIALGLGFRYMPEGQIPYIDKLESSFEDDPDTYNKLKNFKAGNLAITPEIKFYFGKDVFRGFYIAPYARYAEFTGSGPFDFEYEEGNVTVQDKIDLSGKITTISGGVLFGAQWKLSKLVYLNWEILGLHYGSSKGNITGAMAKLSDPDVREGLEEELEELEDADIPLVKIETSVTDKEAKANFTGPWAGLRGSIGIGFRF